MFAAFDQSDERGDIKSIGAQRVRGDLPMEYCRRDIRIVGRGLTPTDGAAVRRQFDKSDKFVAEGLERCNADHQAPCD